MHPTTLVDALSTSPYLTIAHLHAISALSPNSLPVSEQHRSETARTARLQALSYLLHHLLPLTSLSSAVSIRGPQHLSASIASLLQAIRANASLPSILPAPPLPTYIHPHLIRLIHTDFDDVSTSLAQAASTDADELTELWNRIIPTHASSGPDQLPNSILSAKAAIARAHASAAHMDTFIAHTRVVALTTLHNTLRNALTGLEADTEERANNPSAEHVYVGLLCARERAVTAKLKLLRAEIAASMYTPECARALRIIAGEVRSRVREVESLLVDKRLRLQQNYALGAEYLQVVKELTNAKSLLEQNMWARTELNVE